MAPDTLPMDPTGTLVGIASALFNMPDHEDDDAYHALYAVKVVAARLVASVSVDMAVPRAEPSYINPPL